VGGVMVVVMKATPNSRITWPFRKASEPAWPLYKCLKSGSWNRFNRVVLSR